MFRNARVIEKNGILEHAYVLVDGGKISYVGTEIPFCRADQIIDAQNLYLSPGFIDLHVHGGNGYDFMDGTEEAFRGIAEYHSRNGVTSLLTTTLAGEEEETLQVLEAFNRYAGRITDCNLLGVHMEGPYFSGGQRGAQDASYLLLPRKEQYEKFLAFNNILRWSVAPELPGALKMGDELSKRGILLSIAHTEADYDGVVEAAEHGYRLLTHFYSGMLGVHRKGPFRYGGAVEAGLLMDEMFTEIIADGCHLPPCLLKLIYKCKGRGRILLTSDAMRGAGLADGEETVLGSLKNGQRVIIEQGVAMLPDRSSFAGSVASGDRLVRTMRDRAGIPLYEAVGMITENPAGLLGLEKRKGRIASGMDADLILFDEDIRIRLVMTGGRWREI